jgi:hypothetical protein
MHFNPKAFNQKLKYYVFRKNLKHFCYVNNNVIKKVYIELVNKNGYKNQKNKQEMKINDEIF